MLNLLLRSLSYIPFSKFEKSLLNPRETQDTVLQQILRCSNCSHIKSYEEFKKVIPICRFEDAEFYVDKKFISFYEETSGSSGRKKKIPYSKDLIKSFTQYFLIWMYQTLKSIKFKTGKLYFSISPQFGNKLGTIQDDSDYLSGLTGLIFNFFSVAPRNIKTIKDPEAFFYETIKCILRNSKLEVISVWSPSFLLRLLDLIQSNADRLSRDLKLSKTDLAELRIDRLFPSLKLISCWGSSLSIKDFNQIIKVFGNHCVIQEKGLMATEAPMTLPWSSNIFVPLQTEVFFEFISIKDGKIYRLHELELNREYNLVITQKSGLFRYAIGDKVIVNDFVKNTPSLLFLGRENSVSDLVGEKMSEEFLKKELSSFEGYVRILPSLSEKKYYILLDSESGTDFKTILESNFHYLNSIMLGQLKPHEIIIQNDISKIVLNYFITEKGMSIGDIKDQILLAQEYDDKLLKFIKKK